MGLWALLFVGLALLYIIALSFLTRSDGFTVSLPVTGANYEKLISPLYVGALAESLRLAFVTALLCLLIGYPFAYHMARQKPRTRTWLMLLVIIPFWTNALIRIYGWKMLRRQRAHQRRADSCGADRKAAAAALYPLRGAGGHGVRHIPFMVLPIYSAVERMDWSMVEASRDLGAGRCALSHRHRAHDRGRHHGGPGAPHPSIGLFFLSDLLGGSNTMLQGNLVYDELLKSRDHPHAATLSVVLLLLTGLIILLYRRAGGKAEEMVF